MLRITKTENGTVRGFPGTDARITVFKGVPFADDPVGDNRWKAPKPAKNWEGVRNCYEFAPITMQKTPGEDPNAFYSKEWHVDSNIPMSEKGILCVNIWTPAKATDEKLPVMVWIFGGGLREGYAHEMEFDGERIASRGVVFVSVAYRVNVFGFLCHPEITAENPDAPGNFGFLDQKAGIQWVKRNISNFGGNPDNITIFGQSAGAMSVIAQMCSPQTEGLFQKAIIESIGGVSPVYPICRSMPCDLIEDSERNGIEFFEKLGVKTLEEARKLDAAYIEGKFIEGNYFWGATVDGKFLQKTLDEYVLKDELHRIPFIVGNTVDEFLVSASGETDEEVEEWIKANYGPYAEEFTNLCRKTSMPLKEAATINQMYLGNLIMEEVCAKQGREFYSYVFGPTIPGDGAGVFHSSDLWFEFETLMKCWRPFDGHHYDLARKMCNYWTNFAKHGDPNGTDANGKAMPMWNKFTQAAPYSIYFFDEITKGRADEKYEFLVNANLKENSFE